jgi:pimeloyl-ACP methyl ester carboxylesterase
MSTYVLVHGAWHGAWCWSKVVSLLEGAGHKAIALDLPGHGRDDTPIAQVTFEAYCDKVREIVEAQPESVILVGHSMGGRVVTQVAELRPDRIMTLVYIAAILLRHGENTMPADPACINSIASSTSIRRRPRYRGSGLCFRSARGE